MKTITLTIDGRTLTCSSQISILDAARQHGMRIPTLCHHPDLKPFGACRLCLVEDQGTGRLFASCVTPVAQDMNLVTDSPRLLEHRRNIVRLMMAEHPESCIVCGKGNRCQLRLLAAQLGVGEIDLYPMPNYKRLEQANPFIARDLTKCILCGKCIRADHELVVVGAIDYNLRGFRSRPATVHDLPLEQSNCTFCGTCVSICPTGALSPKQIPYVGTPQRESLSICGFCAVGCSLSLGVAYDRVVEVNPSHQPGTVNGSTLCVRGHFAHDFLNGKDRLTRPMLRKDGELDPVSWEEALREVGQRLREMKQTYGPQSIALLGSSKCTNEENYLFQRMGRVLLGTNSVDNGGYAGGRAVLRALEGIQPWPRVQPLKELEHAEAILVWGTDPSHSAPVVGYHLKRAARKGIPLIVVDPRKTDLVPFSTLWLHPEPGSDPLLISALAACMASREKPAGHDQGALHPYREELLGMDLSTICSTCGVTTKELERAADLLQGKKIGVVVGTGITLQREGRRSLQGLTLLVQGALGNGDSLFCVVERENNSAGAWDMGAVPDALPGRVALRDESARRQWERVWQSKISPDRGLSVNRMVEEMENGTLKVLFVMGENPLRSLPQPERVRQALGRLELLIVQDILQTETCDLAHVVLPGAAFSEKAGSFTNLEGRIQKFQPAAPPPDLARPDWEILDLLSVELGAAKGYGSLDRIREEIAHWVPAYGALTGPEAGGWLRKPKELAFPEVDTESPFTDQIAAGEEMPERDFPIQAMIGSHRIHLGSGTRTGRSDRISRFGVTGAVEVHPEDAARLKLKDGDRVRVSSPVGELEREVRVGSGLARGWIFVPAGFDGNGAMNLIGLTPLGSAGSPGWKCCRVRLEKLKG